MIILLVLPGTRIESGLDKSAQKISEHAITILVNLSADKYVLENLATDDRFLDRVFGRIVVCLSRIVIRRPDVDLGSVASVRAECQLVVDAARKPGQMGWASERTK
jgi:hypothetical protein